MMTYSQQKDIGFRYAIEALECASPYGEARAKALRFYAPGEERELMGELQNVAMLAGVLDERKAELGRLERLMMPLKDIRRSLDILEGAALSDVELFELKRFLLQSELIAPVFAALKSAVGFSGIEINAQSEALAVIDPDGSRAATFFIPDGRTPALLGARQEKRAIEEKLRRTVDPASRAALMAERSRAAADEEAEERRILAKLSAALRPYIPGIRAAMDGIAAFDFTLARAKLAKKYGGVIPRLTPSGFTAEGMTNPRISDALQRRGHAFTPVSISAPAGATVITGANMGGKSVALKTVALNAMLVKAGLLPFAISASMPLFDGIYIICEDDENVEKGLSSFGSEIVRFNEVISESASLPGASLILMDEFARGTNPEEGAMIVRAVTRYLDAREGVSILATHYDGVAAFASAHYGVMGLREMDLAAVAQEIAASPTRSGADVIAAHMDYGLYRAEGEESCPRDARNICALLSLDPDILMDI